VRVSGSGGLMEEEVFLSGEMYPRVEEIDDGGEGAKSGTEAEG